MTFVVSRKRKLCELYAVATSAEPLPTRLDPSSTATSVYSDGLARFLEQNDIEKGRRFQEASLPPRLLNAFDLNSRQLSAAAATSQKPKEKDSSVSSHALSKAGSGSLAAPDPIASHVPDGVVVHASAKADDEGPTTVEPRGAFVDVARPTALSQTDTSNERISLSARRRKPSRLESPPYSPEGSSAGPKSSHSDVQSSLDKDPAVDVLTPSKEEDEDEPSQQSSAPPYAPDSKGVPKVGLDHAQPAAESASSPSSTAGHQSTNTSRTDAHSPATSVEEDAARTDLSNRSSQRLPDDVRDDGDVQMTETAGGYAGTKQPGSKLEASTPTSLRDQSNEQPLQKAAAAAAQADSATDTQSQGPRPNLLDSRVLKPRGQGRVKKSQHRKRIAKAFTFAPSKKSERWRIREERLASGMSTPGSSTVAYYKPLILQDALTDTYKADLKSLMENRNKVLSTSERDVANAEDISRMVLSRILHLQHPSQLKGPDGNPRRTRWWLHQMKHSPEPRPTVTFWDHMLRDVKWLGTDFKEERKLKLATARLLASWCAEFVAADAEERKALRIRLRTEPHAQSTSKTEAKVEPMDENPNASVALMTETLSPLVTGQTLCLDKKVLQNIPAYGTSSTSQSSLRHLRAMQQRHTPVPPRDERLMPRSMLGRQFNQQTRIPEPEKFEEPLHALPPEDDSCLLFAADRQIQDLRRRANATHVFKAPNRLRDPMPPQGYYESRMPSQWTYEDDQLLRHAVKEYPANWTLVSEVVRPKNQFYRTEERRSIWDCYERFSNLEAQPDVDPTQRSFLKPFLQKLQMAHHNFDEAQRAAQLQVQQAREAGQPAPGPPLKAFPVPRRVDRKSSKRFLAMLDAARKLARKRETALSKQEKSQQAEAHNPRPPPIKNNVPHDTKYWCDKKREMEAKEAKNLQLARERQRAILESQRRQQAGYPAALTNGIGQQMQSGMAGNHVAHNGHLAVPGLPHAGQQGQPNPGYRGSALANGVPAGVQLPPNARPQTGIQGQRTIPQMNGQSQEDIARLMQQAAQQRFANNQHATAAQGQQNAPGTMNHGSPNNNAAMLHRPGVNQFNGNQFTGNSDGTTSPNFPGGPKSQSSPHAQQALAAAAGLAHPGMNGSRPQALSSGQVPQLVLLEHDIQRANPQMSPSDVRQQATEQLKSAFRRKALDSATGAPQGQNPGQHAHQTMQQQQVQAQQHHGGGSQSPYQHPAPTPQMQSPFQQNGILATNRHPSQQQGVQPPGMTTQQAQYQAAMRHSMIQQQQLHQMPNANGAAGSPSPLMGHLQQGFPQTINRTTTPGGQNMRPPSRSTSGYEVQSGYGFHDMHQRPGSAASAAHSPRPISAQGFQQG